MAATIVDVARMAGCSISTVSRVYSAPEKVRTQTRERILQSAKALHYSPNAIARAMVSQQNHTLAFVIGQQHYPIMLNPFYAAIAEAAQMLAEQSGYSMSILSANSVQQSPELFHNKRVDGAIFAGQSEGELLYDLRRQGVPIVLVNNGMEIDGIPSIVSEDYAGTVQALEHFISRGHRQIGLIAGNLYPYISSIRYRAYFDTMAKHGLTVNPAFCRTVDANQQAALKCVQELLRMQQPPGALFCMNDSIAVGAIKAALRMGCRVPEDLAVIGFDNSSVCTVIEPELTSVSVDKQQMGELAVSLLIQQITGQLSEIECHRLPTKLVVRHSS